MWAENFFECVDFIEHIVMKTTLAKVLFMLTVAHIDLLLAFYFGNFALTYFAVPHIHNLRLRIADLVTDSVA